MTTVNKKFIQNDPFFTSDGCGNKAVAVFTLEVNASGVLVSSDLATALQIGDVVRVGVLPAGFKMIDALFIASDAFTANVTADIGFAYVDGVDSTVVPEDADYFGSAIALATAGRYPADNVAVKPETLPKDAYVTLTMAGAACAAAGRVDVVIYGVHTGTP
jgi:hypothetical protein